VSTGTFEAYSRYYDLLYADKDYVEEAGHVADVLAKYGMHRGSLLEFGSGTGKHGQLFASMGFHVVGVERSPEMVAIANQQSPRRSAKLSNTNAGGCRSPGSFSCQIGDIRSVRMGRIFDAVLSLFHVVSYQTSNADVRNLFASAAAHLSRGGLFFFDVWHGPAVLTQRPGLRVKRMKDAKTSILRIAEPELDSRHNIVAVNYTVLVEDRINACWQTINETHAMRYFFHPEVELLATESEFDIVQSEEFLTGAAPSESTWSVAYLLRKRS
jgi:SAM-dependent methyltransferase